MIIDSRNEFCDAVALNTGAPGNYLLGNQIDLGANNDMGSADPDLYLVITIDTTVTFAAGSGQSVQFSLCSDSTAAIATNGTQTTHLKTPFFAAAQLVAGNVLLCACLPYSQVSPYEEFVGIVQTTAGAAVTAGKINAFLTKDPQAWLPMTAAV